MILIIFFLVWLTAIILFSSNIPMIIYNFLITDRVDRDISFDIHNNSYWNSFNLYYDSYSWVGYINIVESLLNGNVSWVEVFCIISLIILLSSKIYLSLSLILVISTVIFSLIVIIIILEFSLRIC